MNTMSPVRFIGWNNKGCAEYRRIRHGTRDSHTLLTAITKPAVSLETRNKEVNT
jgi:hypothetical protein